MNENVHSVIFYVIIFMKKKKIKGGGAKNPMNPNQKQVEI